MRRPSPLPGLVALVFALLAMSPARALPNKTTLPACAAQQSVNQGAPICRWIDAGELSGLRWPDFTFYREQARQFYGPALAPVWTSNGAPTPQARALIELFQHADEKGLEPEDYDASRWADRLARFSAAEPATAEELARFDLALTVSALRYVSHLHHGRVNPADFETGLKTASFDAAGFLRSRVIGASDVASAMAQAEPAWPEYKRLLKAYQEYRELARGGEGAPIPHGDQDVEPGMKWAGVMQLAARLRRTGDFPADAQIAHPDTYEEPLFSAMKRFEGKHGIEPDGILGPDTYRQLETPFAQRALQLKLAIERWRWMPSGLGPRFIAVNLPEFRVRAYENQRPVLAMRAIVGEAEGHRTPMFVDQVEFVVFRPYWNIPLNIQKNEVLPDLKKEPQYLVKHQMELVNGAGRVVPATLTPAVLQQIDAGKLAVRQQPGPDNALGLVKFVFGGRESIYLHGTPEKNLFSSYRRDFSHGCVRVEDPAELAAWVLRGYPAWTTAHIQGAMHGKDSVNVRMARPIPVLMVYNTATVEENGDIHFYDDIYGQDTALEKALAAPRQ